MVRRLATTLVELRYSGVGIGVHNVESIVKAARHA